jgi:hypothetical protein
MDSQSRNDKITILLNGRIVAEHAGDLARSKTGTIGLQLHDQFRLFSSGISASERSGKRAGAWSGKRV